MVLDTVIIGAGAMGSSSAYWLSKFQDVALIEQFELLHTRGSSHGQSRVIRKTYQQDYFSEMMSTSYQLWDAVQQETGKTVFTNTGGLDVGREGNSDLKRTLDICKRTGLSHEVLDANELRSKYPAYQNVSDDYYAIYQEETGILDATKAVAMFQQQASKQGTQIMQNTPVLSIKPLDDGVIVETAKGSFQAKHAVISVGSWINLMLRDLGYELATEVWKLTFAYFKVEHPELYITANFPVFIHWAETANYGFPINEKPGYVKIAPHMNDLIDKVPENDNNNPANIDLINDVVRFIENTFTGIDTQEYQTETCLYTMTENENFIIDQLPDHDNVTIVGGFSGHGFKFTPFIGNIVQNMVMGNEIDFNMNHFRLKNFLK